HRRFPAVIPTPPVSASRFPTRIHSTAACRETSPPHYPLCSPSSSLLEWKRTCGM
ncbi:unnamed protein product, partial [Linum tenue]